MLSSKTLLFYWMKYQFVKMVPTYLSHYHTSYLLRVSVIDSQGWTNWFHWTLMFVHQRQSSWRLNSKPLSGAPAKSGRRFTVVVYSGWLRSICWGCFHVSLERALHWLSLGIRRLFWALYARTYILLQVELMCRLRIENRVRFWMHGGFWREAKAS